MEILNQIAEWVKEQEKLILNEGKVLPPASMRDAKDLGIKGYDLIRVKETSNVPLPPALSKLGYEYKTPRGVAYGYGLYVQDINERGLIYHELVHVRQMEKMGRDEFVKQYIRDCMKYTYRFSPFEREAYNLTEEFEKTL